jgi:NCS2 family nucleobase:cation symporter-2
VTNLIYGIEDRPPAREAVALALQHLLVMLLGNVTPPLLIALALGLDTSDTALLIQTALVMAGLATLVQSYPLGPVGGRLPIVMGTSIVFMGSIIAIAGAYNLATALGACLVAASAELVFAQAVTRARRLFPPLVSAVIVMLIGLTLIPIGVDYAAGGVGSEHYGAPSRLGIALLVGAVTLGLHQFARGLASTASIFFGVAAGYLAALALGLVDVSAVAAAPWLSAPRPLAFGLELHLGPILLMAVVYLISAIETVGDISAIVAVTGREVTTSELRGGLLADGAMSAFAALFGAFPNTSFSQNVGLVSFTRVASRHVTALTGVLLVALGLVPKVGAAFTTIPASVVGGAGLILFAMIFASGVAILHRSVELDQRNLVIVAVAVALGLGVELRPEVLQGLPGGLRSFLGSGLATGGLSAAALNLVFPEDA